MKPNCPWQQSHLEEHSLHGSALRRTEQLGGGEKSPEQDCLLQCTQEKTACEIAALLLSE